MAIALHLERFALALALIQSSPHKSPKKKAALRALEDDFAKKLYVVLSVFICLFSHNRDH